VVTHTDKFTFFKATKSSAMAGEEEGAHSLATAAFLSNPFWHNLTSQKGWS